jgi:DNA polymerase-3 subunit chi
MTQNATANIYKAILPIEKVLPRLIEGIVKKEHRILLVVDTEELKKWDDLLWTYAQLSFLPHYMKGDQGIDDTKIYITDSIEDNANNADVLIWLRGELMQGGLSDFAKVILFDGENSEQLAQHLSASHFQVEYIAQEKSHQWKKVG